MDLGRPPLLRVLPKRDQAPGRVDVQAPGQVPTDVVQEALGVLLAMEGPGLLRAARELPPPGQ